MRYTSYLWIVLLIPIITTCTQNRTIKEEPSSITVTSSPVGPPQPTRTLNPQLIQNCLTDLKKLPGKFDLEKLKSICSEVEQLPSCTSVKGKSIYHFDRIVEGKHPIKILVFALIHGDEPISGGVVRSWMERLVDLSPRNNWRIIPILNPDGFNRFTRTNVNGVDLNRNFPSQHWDKEVQNYWRKTKKKDPRYYPGSSSASEPETRCAIKHIETFEPNFIISIHTPLGLLDLDGPEVDIPKNASFPWSKLGNYPGSLGRYMWRDNQTPVLTIELKGPEFLTNIEQIDRLQDLSGLLARMANQKQKEGTEKDAESEQEELAKQES